MKTKDKQISNDQELDKLSMPIKNSITLDVFRSYKGCGHYSDDQAIEIIQSLEKLSAICHNLSCQSNVISIDNQHIVYLNPLQGTKLKAA